MSAICRAGGFNGIQIIKNKKAVICKNTPLSQKIVTYVPWYGDNFEQRKKMYSKKQVSPSINLGTTGTQQQASVPIALFLSTGLSTTGNVLPLGSEDPNYTIIMDAGTVVNAPAPIRGAFPSLVTSFNIFPDVTATWIGFVPMKPEGEYRIFRTFDLSPYNHLLTTLELAYTVSDTLTQVLLNDVPVDFAGFQYSSIPTNGWSPQLNITTGFLQGINKIEFRWRNVGFGHTGLQVAIKAKTRTAP